MHAVVVAQATTTKARSAVMERLSHEGVATNVPAVDKRAMTGTPKSAVPQEKLFHAMLTEARMPSAVAKAATTI